VLEVSAVDPEKVIVAGASQGGAMALAVAALSHSVRAAIIDVPFLCHIRRALKVTDSAPYSELSRYLAVQRRHTEVVFDTLGYFDGLNLAPRATAPALFSAGLMDDVTPPSTVFAAFHHYAGPKQIVTWPFNGHDAGQLDQVFRHFAFLRELDLAAP
jgi:cephalosporin-C deacetylase